MTYFANFPDILYPFELGGKIKLVRVKDIVSNVRIRKQILSNITLYDEYDITDGETPEIIAERVYGDPTLHWVIMLVNDRYDLWNDFPMSGDALSKYIENKYGQGNENDQHIIFDSLHFEDERGNIVDGPATNLVRAITNLEYETRVNESKRRIKIVNKTLIANIVSELDASFEKFDE
jgi:hypothetical protein